jgi:hypothetical protein
MATLDPLTEGKRSRRCHAGDEVRGRATASARLFSGFVLYDIQRLRYAEGTQSDAVMLAVSIYLDIFNLFLAILRLFGILRS